MKRRRIFFRQSDLEPERGPCPPMPPELDLPRAQVKAFERQHGVEGVRRMYDLQRRSAWDRGIGWELSLAEWLGVWGANIVRRGQGRDALMMCRRNDKGPYSAENVYLGTAHENATDRHVKGRIAKWSRWFRLGVDTI